MEILIESKPNVALHFYYNTDTKSFAIEDPALFYFIKHLDWNQLRQDCGFREQGEDFEFDVALSFAGENRELAAHIAEALTTLDVTVFYDEYFEANYLGKALVGTVHRGFRSQESICGLYPRCSSFKKDLADVRARGVRAEGGRSKCHSDFFRQHQFRWDTARHRGYPFYGRSG